MRLLCRDSSSHGYGTCHFFLLPWRILETTIRYPRHDSSVPFFKSLFSLSSIKLCVKPDAETLVHTCVHHRLGTSFTFFCLSDRDGRERESKLNQSEAKRMSQPTTTHGSPSNIRMTHGRIDSLGITSILIGLFVGGAVFPSEMHCLPMEGRVRFSSGWTSRDRTCTKLRPEAQKIQRMQG